MKQKEKRKLSEEHKRRIRENARINPIFGMKGKHMSEEAKNKLRIPKKQEQIRKTVETRRKNNSYICSRETKRKISETKKKNPTFFSEETRKKISLSKIGEKNPMFGKHLSEETKNKISNFKKGKSFSDEHKDKISKSNKGKIHSKEHIKKISAKKQGILLERWKKFTSREPYDQSFNNKFKREIRKRDNQICMLCGIHREKLSRALCIHHIDYSKTNTFPQNCISLCLHCHIKTNKNRISWTKFFQSLLSEKYGYEYSQEGDIVIKLNELDKN